MFEVEHGECSNLLECVFWQMLLIQTGQAKRLRKFAILTLLGMMLVSGWGVVLTMHWHVKPPRK